MCAPCRCDAADAMISAKAKSELAQAPGSVEFECEACGLTGEVEDPKHMESISCPNCNARYLYFPEGQRLGAKSPWQCVVRPYFADTPNTELTDRRGAGSVK